MTTTALTLTTDQLLHHIEVETRALSRAIQRAERDLRDARDQMRKGNRPGGSVSRRVLSQTALDVDQAAARLNVLFDLSSGVDPVALAAAYERGQTS